MNSHIITTQANYPLNSNDPLLHKIKTQFENVHHIPLLDIEHLKPEPKDLAPISKHVLVSSKHAVPYVTANKHVFADSSFICIGQSSALALQSLGLKVSTVFETSREFMNSTNPNDHDLLYLRGADVRFDIKGHYQNAHTSVKELIVYKANKNHHNAVKLLNLNTSENILLLYSKRAAETLRDQLSQEGDTSFCTRTKLLCMSKTVLNSVSCPSYKWMDTQIARTPNQRSLIDALNTLLKT